jgi:hypothetical protein
MINHQDAIQQVSEWIKGLSKDDFKRHMEESRVGASEWTKTDTDGLEDAHFGMRTRFETEKKLEQFYESLKVCAREPGVEFLKASICALKWVLGEDNPTV